MIGHLGRLYPVYLLTASLCLCGYIFYLNLVGDELVD